MAILIGTSGDDVITGTAGDDVIDGFGGKDWLEGLAGNDTLRGGDDDDRLWGGEGDDTLEGGAGNDILHDHYGDDLLDGGEGNDTLESLYGGNDVLRGGAGDDSFTIDHVEAPDHVEVDGGIGNDYLTLFDFMAGEHIVDMGAGDDLVRIASVLGVAQITLGAGQDLIELPEFFASSVGKGGSALVADFTPGDAGDRVEFLDLVARLFANWDQSLSPFATGHIRLVQNGADALLQFDVDGGGDGYVTVLTFQNTSAAAFTAWNLDGYPADGSIPAGQQLTGTAGVDRLKGAAGADTINGLDGDDWLRGGAGADVITGGGGFNRIDGQTGDDEIHGGGDRDEIDGGYGSDEIFGGGGGDYITSMRGADTLDGGDGGDTFSINRGSLTVETVTATGGSGDDRFDLSSYGASTLVVDGGGDDDIVYLHVLAGAADITLGEGADRLVLSQFQVDFLANSGSATVADFNPADGDVLDFTDFASFAFFSWDGSENPFGAGYMRLVQDGANTLLQIDRTGGNASWRTIVTFEGVAPAAFTAASLSGFAPDGSAPPGIVIEGTPGSDSLQGSGGSDTIDGYGGQDFIEGSAGEDLIRGGADADILSGGTGDDELQGGDGDDHLDGRKGDDLLLGGDGDDTIFDGFGSDIVHGGAGDDYLTLQRNASYFDTVRMFAEEGNDVLWLSLPAFTYATIDMGSGDDLVLLGPVEGILSLTLGSGADTVDVAEWGFDFDGGDIELTDFAAGEDVLDLEHFLIAYLQGWDQATNPFETGYARLVQDGADTLVQFDADGGGDGYVTWFSLLGVAATALGASNIGFDVQATYGTASDDNLVGTASGEGIHGEGGNDVIDGAGGSDEMTGGLGDDIFYVDDAGDQAIELAGGGIDEIRTSLDSYSLLGTHVENLTATTNVAHDFRGSAGNNVIAGSVGNDVLRLQDGGADTASGGAGNDILYFGGAFSGADVANGGDGRDVLILQGNYALTLSATNLAGIESISLQSGARTTWGDTANNFYDYNITMNDLNVGGGEQLIVNGQSLRIGEDFTFNGAAESGDGKYLVYGGHGVDTFKGGAGNDVFFFEGARFGPDDKVDGGAGRDAIVISSGSGVNRFEFGDDALTSIESISLNNRFTSDPSQKPSYELVLGSGNVASGATLIVNGSSLSDRTQVVSVDGSAVQGNLILLGGFGDDILTGGDGADRLQGGEGIDVLTGGGGADTFRYASQYDATPQLPDRILDFVSGTDRIDLSTIDADVFAAGNQAFRWIGSSAFGGTGAASAGELRAYAFNGNWFVEGDMDGNGAADLVIQLTAPVAPILEGDFLL